jgi:hypothetical protein
MQTAERDLVWGAVMDYKLLDVFHNENRWRGGLVVHACGVWGEGYVNYITWSCDVKEHVDSQKGFHSKSF